MWTEYQWSSFERNEICGYFFLKLVGLVKSSVTHDYMSTT